MGVRRLAPVETSSLDDRIADIVTRAVDNAFIAHGGEPPSLTLNVAEAAEQLRTSTETIRRLILEGTLPTVPGIRGRYIIPRAALEAYVNGPA